jgi:hypothetical protein
MTWLARARRNRCTPDSRPPAPVSATPPASPAARPPLPRRRTEDDARASSCAWAPAAAAAAAQLPSPRGLPGLKAGSRLAGARGLSCWPAGPPPLPAMPPAKLPWLLPGGRKPALPVSSSSARAKVAVGALASPVPRRWTPLMTACGAAGGVGAGGTVASHVSALKHEQLDNSWKPFNACP